MTTETLSQFVRADFHDRSREADQLLTEVCLEGRELLAGERAFLAREMGWDVAEIKKQRRRVSGILRLKAICGRPEDRVAAATEAQIAADLLAKEGPKIEQKIQELQSKMAAMERDERLSAKRVEEQTDAVTQLRRLCPEDVAEAVRAEVKVVEAGVGQDLRDATARAHTLRCAINDGVYDSPKKHIEYSLLNFAPEAVETIVVNSMIQRRYSAAWPTLRAEFQAELAELNERLPELQAEYDSQIQAAEKPLDYHSDRHQIDA